MITTTYTCDRCQESQDGDGQFWRVGVVADNVQIMREYGTQPTRYPANDRLRMHVCRQCLISIGIQVPPPIPGESAPARPTLEDIIREIVQNAQS